MTNYGCEALITTTVSSDSGKRWHSCTNPSGPPLVAPDSLNTPCPHCGHNITPEERTHVDTEHLECPQLQEENLSLESPGNRLLSPERQNRRIQPTRFARTFQPPITVTVSI